MSAVSGRVEVFRNDIETILGELFIQFVEVLVSGSCSDLSSNACRRDAIQKADGPVLINNDGGYGLSVSGRLKLNGF